MRSLAPVTVLAFHLAATAAASDQPRILRANPLEPQAARAALERSGVRVSHILPGGRLVVLSAPGAVPPRLPAGVVDEGLLQAPLAPVTSGLTTLGDDVVGLPVKGGAAAAAGPTPPSASPAMVGDIVLGLALPESTGAVNPSELDWTPADVEHAVQTAVAGTMRYVLAPGAPRLTFRIVLLDAPPPGGVAGTVACAYEANRNSVFDEDTDSSWLTALGYPGPARPAGRRLAGDLRDRFGANAAYLAKVVLDGGRPASRAAAQMGGPEVMWYLSQGPFEVAHETGHAFGALDEYCPDACRSPSEAAGLSGAANANARGNDGSGYLAGSGEGLACVMLTDATRICPHTRSQIGWDDSDGNGVADVADLFGHVTTLSAALTVEGGRADGNASLAPYLGNQAVRLGSIARVEVRVARGAWIEAVPLDGAFDSPEEDFTATLPALPDGSYVVEARAVSAAGNIEPQGARAVVTIAGSGATDAAPAAALTSIPETSSVGAEVILDASASSDLEGAPLEARFDFEGVASFTAWGSLRRSYRYPASGTYLARVEVRDPAGNVSTATRRIEVSDTPLPPVVRLALEPRAVYGADRGEVGADARYSFDPEGGPLRFRFQFGAALATGLGAESGASAAVESGLSESVPVTVTAEAQDGRTASVTRVVRMVSYDHAPTATLAVRPGEVAGEYTLDASGSSDPDLGEPWEGPLSWRFDFEGDGSFDTPFLPAQPVIRHTYAAESTLAPVVEVRDRYGAVARATAVLDLRSLPVFSEGVSPRATATSCGVEIGWNPATALAGPVTYAIYRSDLDDPASVWELQAVVGRTRFLDVTAPDGHRLAYTVRAWTPGEPPLEDANQETVAVSTVANDLTLRLTHAGARVSLLWDGGTDARVRASSSKRGGDEIETGHGSGRVDAEDSRAVVFFRVQPGCASGFAR